MNEEARGAQERTRPRVITSSVGAELSPPTRGAHRPPIGRNSQQENTQARLFQSLALSHSSLFSFYNIHLCLAPPAPLLLFICIYTKSFLSSFFFIYFFVFLFLL